MLTTIVCARLVARSAGAFDRVLPCCICWTVSESNPSRLHRNSLIMTVDYRDEENTRWSAKLRLSTTPHVSPREL